MKCSSDLVGFNKLLIKIEARSSLSLLRECFVEELRHSFNNPTTTFLDDKEKLENESKKPVPLR
jgi:hypothetical protein